MYGEGDDFERGRYNDIAPYLQPGNKKASQARPPHPTHMCPQIIFLKSVVSERFLRRVRRLSDGHVPRRLVP